MARFLRNSISLSEWVKSHGSVRKAIDAISSLPGIQKESLTDITEMTRRIISGNNSDNAANTLFRLFSSHGITEDHVADASARSDQAEVADDLLKNNVISADEHTTMLKQAQIVRQTGIYDMPLRFCPKLPKQTAGKGLVSTFNCREYCSESLVLDDDPMRVFCLETMWRQHVMDKFSREWKNRETGEWVGGYINNRFFSFPTAGTPSNPDAPRDGGNPLQLKPGERTRQPRPHQWSTERRLQEQRDPKSTEAIVLAQVGEGNMIKLASNNADSKDIIYQAFSEAIRLNKDGMPACDAALKISEACDIPIGMVVKIQEAAIRKVVAHTSDVYQMEKTASDSQTMDMAQDAEDLGLTEKTNKIEKCPRCGKETHGASCELCDNQHNGKEKDSQLDIKKMTSNMSSPRGNYKKATTDDSLMSYFEDVLIQKNAGYQPGFLDQKLDTFVCNQCNREVYGGVEEMRDHLEQLHDPAAEKMTSSQISSRFSKVTKEPEEEQSPSAVRTAETQSAPDLKAKTKQIMLQYPNSCKAFLLGRESGARESSSRTMEGFDRYQFAEDILTIAKGASPMLSANDYYKQINAVTEAKTRLSQTEVSFSENPETGTSPARGVQPAKVTAGQKISDGVPSDHVCGCSYFKGERRQGPPSSSDAHKDCPCKQEKSESQG